MPPSTLLACLSLSPASESLVVDVLGIAIVLLVERRTRGISKDVRLTSQEVEATLTVAHTLLGRSESPRPAQDRKK